MPSGAAQGGRREASCAAKPICQLGADEGPRPNHCQSKLSPPSPPSPAQGALSADERQAVEIISRRPWHLERAPDRERARSRSRCKSARWRHADQTAGSRHGAIPSPPHSANSRPTNEPPSPTGNNHSVYATPTAAAAAAVRPAMTLEEMDRLLRAQTNAMHIQSFLRKVYDAQREKFPKDEHRRYTRRLGRRLRQEQHGRDKILNGLHDRNPMMAKRASRYRHAAEAAKKGYVNGTPRSCVT